MNRTTMRALTLAGATALALGTTLAPAVAMPTVERGTVCVEPSGAAARGDGAQHQGTDHRDVSATEQRAIERQTAAALARQGGKLADGATVPVYVHVMRDDTGQLGDVTDRQIREQIAVLNETFSGGESSTASDSGFRFELADVQRYDNTTWHYDRASAKYRSETRRGGADALNMWLVDFDYLGIATFPWDYSKQGRIDGIRVHYDSLPGGGIANYNLGETATHEAGHWFGLYHTFQGGCTETNDEVSDTPAQSAPTRGCPEGSDTCGLPGLDPIHNYMDYSYDSCYTEFTGGQSARMAEMWTAYRAS